MSSAGDIYSGFDDSIKEITPTTSVMNTQRSLVSSNTLRGNTSSIGTSYKNDNNIRPMTSNKSMGYNTSIKKNNNNSNNINNNKSDILYDDIKEEEPFEIAKNMEKNINELIYMSINKSIENENLIALDIAKNARKKEKELILYRLNNNFEEFGSSNDITISVLFNLGHIYELNKMYNEAINVYNILIKKCQKISLQYSLKWKINIGNIYYKQKKYNNAIKMYQMCYDELDDIII